MSEAAPNCASCGATLEFPLACGACGALAAPEREPDPFAVLGLAPQYFVDAAEVKKRSLRLGRLLHPDYFGAADDATRALAERNTARLNHARETLLDACARGDWLVRSLGGPSENEQRDMPKAFLLEVLEWNEQLERVRESSTRDLAGLESLRNELDAQRAAALAALGRALEPLPQPSAPALREARAQLNVLRYLDNALAQIQALELDSPTPHA